MSEPPGNEKGSLQGASLTDLCLTTTNTGIVNQSGAKVKPVAGAGFENGSMVPVVESPLDVPVPTKPNQEQIALVIALRAIRWTAGNKSRLAVFDSVLGDDRRKISVCAAGSPTSFYRHLSELRGLIVEWRTELESEGA